MITFENIEKVWIEKLKQKYQETNLPNFNLVFHWYENFDDNLIQISKEGCNKIINTVRKKYLFKKTFDEESEINNKTFYQIKKYKPIRIFTLKKILKTLELSYLSFDRYIIAIGSRDCLFKIDFPLVLARKDVAILIGGFMSDGCNDKEHPFYANTGFLGNKMIKSAQNICPNISWEIRHEKIRFHPILSRILLKLGVPCGRKVIFNPITPLFLWSNELWSKIYLTQIFDDEGHAVEPSSRKIVLGRSVALDNLPKDFIDNLPFKQKVYFNNLPKNIKNFIVKSPPLLLLSEYFMLKRFDINSSMRCRGITKYEKWISADWVIEIYGKENMKKFQDMIGFSEPSKINQMKMYIAG
jgi:hypothetical protein